MFQEQVIDATKFSMDEHKGLEQCLSTRSSATFTLVEYPDETFFNVHSCYYCGSNECDQSKQKSAPKMTFADEW